MNVCASVRSGFTLIEVLVASTMFALVLAAVYATFRGVSSASLRAGTTAEVSQTARVVLDDIANRLSCFYPLEVSDSPEASQPGAGASQSAGASQNATALLGEDIHSSRDDQAELDSITFVTVAGTSIDDMTVGTTTLRNTPISGISTVRYRVIENEYGSRQLIREVRPVIGASIPDVDPEIAILSDRVAALNFQYFDGEQGQWLPTWSDPQKTPEAIAIQVAIYRDDNKGRPERFSRVVRLPSVTRFASLPESKAPTPTGSDGGGGGGGRRRGRGGRNDRGRDAGGRDRSGGSGEGDRARGGPGPIPGRQFPGGPGAGNVPGMMPGGGGGGVPVRPGGAPGPAMGPGGGGGVRR